MVLVCWPRRVGIGFGVGATIGVRSSQSIHESGESQRLFGRGYQTWFVFVSFRLFSRDIKRNRNGEKPGGWWFAGQVCIGGTIRSEVADCFRGRLHLREESAYNGSEGFILTSTVNFIQNLWQKCPYHYHLVTFHVYKC